MPRLVFLFLILFSLTACTSPRLERQWKDRPIGRAFAPQNVYAAGELDPAVRLVAVLPFSESGAQIEFMPEAEQALVEALRRQGRFEVVQVSVADLDRVIGKTRIALRDEMPSDLRAYLQERLGADAVMQNEITAFRPYKPMVLGLQSRLVALPGGEILWSCDEILDAGNERVALGARKFSESELDQPYPLQSSYSSLLSPQRFAAYVGHTLYATLPPRALSGEKH